MEQKLQKFLDTAFAPYGDFPARKDVQQELLVNLQDKVNDLRAEGKNDDEAYKIATESFGDVAEIMEEVPHTEAKASEKPQQSTARTIFETVKETLTGNSTSRVKAVDLQEADLADVNLAGSDFSMSALMNVSFNGSDLTGSVFKSAAVSGASFVGANLSNVVASSSDFMGADFTKANLSGAKLTTSAFNKAIFKETDLTNTEFNKSDLSGQSFEGITLRGTSFNSTSLKNTSFKNAVLEDVSFHHSAVKHTIFEGATMDKLTYALLKGAKATLTDVIIK